MPIFLTADQAYRLIQRTLPKGVYPDGAPSAYFSTADSGATASGIADAYTNLSRIYDNMFPGTADEQQTDWEIQAFGYQLDPTLSLAQRRADVIAKLTNTASLSTPDRYALIYSIIGLSALVEIIRWGQSPNGLSGVWILGLSQLGINTWLGGGPMLAAFGPDLCNKTPADFGISNDAWLAMKQDAYTYEVRIYGQTLSADVRAALDAALTPFEAARSTHVITDGLDPSTTVLRDAPLADDASMFLHFHADDWIGSGSWSARKGSYVAAPLAGTPDRVGIPALGYENSAGTFTNGVPTTVGGNPTETVTAGFEVPPTTSIAPGAGVHWSIECKFFLASLGEGSYLFKARGTSGSLSFKINGDGSYLFKLTTSALDWAHSGAGVPNTFVAGKFYLVTFTVNMTTHEVRTYINGVFLATFTYSAAGSYDGAGMANALDLAFDNDVSIPGYLFPLDGQLIELTMTSRFFTDDEIAARAAHFNYITSF